MKLLSIKAASAVLALAGALCALPAAAQLVNYSEALGAYKDSKEAGIKLVDGVTPSVTAKARVAKALEDNKVVEQQALVQPDGTLKIPTNQTNLVIRTNYNNVQQGADGQVRIASPTIQGNVSGNVTLFVDGKGVENITVLNNGR